MDTSTMHGSIALTESEKVLTEWALNVQKTHSERLLPGIQFLFQETGLTLEHLEAIAVTIGPGSFTGLRIGLATAKALALATGKPLVGIPSLDVIVENTPCFNGLVCAALNARRGELYAALYRKSPDGQAERVTEYLAVSPESLLEMIQEPALIIGDGVEMYGEQLQKESRHPLAFVPMELNYPRASVLCRMATKRYSMGSGGHPRDIKALYVRPSDAEINLKSKGNK